MIAYTRFKVSNKGILWAKLDEGFSPTIINFFSQRYPLFYIMVESKGVTYIKKDGRLVAIKKTVDEVVNDYEKVLPEMKFLKGLDISSEELWNTFYDTQYIKERKNHKLFYHFIPKYLKNASGLKKEFDSLLENNKITSFIKKE